MARVLVVDDEADYRLHLDEIVSAEGHVVETAEHGRRALEIAESFCPEVLIVDLLLGGEPDGMRVAGTLRDSFPGLPIIIMTGYPSAEAKVQARKLHALDFLEKPFCTDELLHALRRALTKPTGLS